MENGGVGVIHGEASGAASNLRALEGTLEGAGKGQEHEREGNGRGIPEAKAAMGAGVTNKHYDLTP